jgi:hypothetical protein
MSIEVTPEKILARAKILHIDMLADQIRIRQHLCMRFFKEEKDDELKRQSQIKHQLVCIFLDRINKLN